MYEKPKCPLIGQNGNIFNLMGIASKTLKRNGMYDEAKEMCSRITSSGSYYEALNVIGEYVEITSTDDEQTEDEDMENGDDVNDVLFIGMMIGVIIGTTIGSLAVAFKSAEKEIARLDKEVKDAHKQS